MSSFSFIYHQWAFAAQTSQEALYEQNTHETPKYIIDQNAFVFQYTRLNGSDMQTYAHTVKQHAL